MSFISYAQNLEDVMLYRALKQVEHGFYIDVGANHPVSESVTRAFYDLGWHGINIEPSHEYFKLLKKERKNDVNLNVAVLDHKGEEIFHEVVNTGMSTINGSYADIHAKAGLKVRSYTVPCTTLDLICVEYKVGAVHFLNIDVEGAEKAVLKGFAFTEVRPWIVLIEANAPNSTRDVSKEWESVILSKGYKMVYYDGLNRFYLAEEKLELQVHFNAPPNIFDGYIPYQQWISQQELASEQSLLKSVSELLGSTQQQLENEKVQLQSTQQELASEKAQRESLTTQIQTIYASVSWRLTAPLWNFLAGSFGRVIKQSIGFALSIMIRSATLRKLGLKILEGHPIIKAKLRIMINMGSPRLTGIFIPIPIKVNSDVDSLPESVRVIYTSLSELYKTHNKKNENCN